MMGWEILSSRQVGMNDQEEADHQHQGEKKKTFLLNLGEDQENATEL